MAPSERAVRDSEPAAVLCVGEAMISMAPSIGELRDCDDVQLFVAGAEANVAAGLAHLGQSVQWFGRVGADPFGRRIVDYLQAHGVDVADVVVDPTRATGIYFKDRGAHVGSTYYYRRESAASALSPDDVPGLEIKRRKWVHLSGITPALSEECANATLAIMRAGIGQTTVSFDVNYRPTLWPSRKVAADRLVELARMASVVITGRDEAQTLWGTTDAAAIARLFCNVDTVVVKDASVGATEFRNGRATFARAPAVDVVEPIGAGDAFAAGYIGARLAARHADMALRLGHVLAAHALMAVADSPSLPDVARLYAFANLGENDWNDMYFTPHSTGSAIFRENGTL